MGSALATTLILVAVGSAWALSTGAPSGGECGVGAINRFSGRNVLVTGASGGLGRALAAQLARCGVATLILSGRDTVALEDAAVECRSAFVQGQGDRDVGKLRVEIVPCDLSDPGSVRVLGEKALEVCSSVASPMESGAPGGDNSGVVDVLLNCGGVSSRSSFLDTAADVDEVLMNITFGDISTEYTRKRVVSTSNTCICHFI